MATYIDLVKTVRLLSGMQGTGPTSVTTAQGVEQVLVRFVRDAYVEIQSYREDFEFLENSRTFSTSAGKGTYTKLDIFGVSNPTFKSYQKDSVVITNSNGKKNYIPFIERDQLEARYLNDSNQKLPQVYTINPPDRALILKPIPDGVYNVSFRYQESPEILTTDTQVPKLPLHFHNLIVYKALEKMAVYLGVPELYREYATEAVKMEGQLMRTNLPKMRLRSRPFA